MENTLLDADINEQEQLWHIESVDYDTFVKLTKDKLKNIFNKPEFSKLNVAKTSEIIYLLIYKRGSVRFALTVGKDCRGELRCPFSAPFGYPEEIKATQSIKDYYFAVSAINSYINQFVGKGMEIILPPLFYDNEVISAWVNAFTQNGWYVNCFEINYALNIPEIMENYESKIAHNARKNLRIAEQSGLQLIDCVDESEKREAYHIIKKNRESKGYPLRMSEEQVMKTISVVKSDMFIVCLEKTKIAAALVYEISESILQVVYWGDIPGYSDKKPINFLAYELLKIYKQKGYKYLDIGPASEHGMADFGLCEFKDSIGCKRCLKIRLEKRNKIN